MCSIHPSIFTSRSRNEHCGPNKTSSRPISIIPVISLILERHVSKYFQKILKPLIYSITYNSGQTALIQILDDWISAVDKNQIDGTLFLDLSKAFDLVNHAILLQKSSHYSLHDNAIDWFKSYLHSRTQNTFIPGDIHQQLLTYFAKKFF